MAKVVALHEADALVMPLAKGASLRVTRFVGSPRVALVIQGPGGGDAGGFILAPDRARLLASWLEAAATGRGPIDADRPPLAGTRRRRGVLAAMPAAEKKGRRAPGRAR
jgi:hypothetical protein